MSDSDAEFKGWGNIQIPRPPGGIEWPLDIRHPIVKSDIPGVADVQHFRYVESKILATDFDLSLLTQFLAIKQIELTSTEPVI